MLFVSRVATSFQSRVDVLPERTNATVSAMVPCRGQHTTAERPPHRKAAGAQPDELPRICVAPWHPHHETNEPHHRHPIPRALGSVRAHSHALIPGGFEVTSGVIRFTSGTIRIPNPRVVRFDIGGARSTAQLNNIGVEHALHQESHLVSRSDDLFTKFSQVEILFI